MTILRLANLVQPMSQTIRHRPNPDRDLKFLRQVHSQLLGELRGPGREDVDVLGHPRFIDVRVHRVGTEEHGVGPPAEELQHGVVDRRQRQGLAHEELSKCQRAVPEHDSPPQETRYPGMTHFRQCNLRKLYRGFSRLVESSGSGVDTCEVGQCGIGMFLLAITCPVAPRPGRRLPRLDRPGRHPARAGAVPQGGGVVRDQCREGAGDGCQDGDGGGAVASGGV